MQVLTFRWCAKYGHFLRAEANVNALTYPVPPRTAVLGLLGAILGLEKDRLPLELDGTLVSVSSGPIQRFWHRVKLRKDPPAALPWRVARSQKGTDSPEKATLILQEWLINPDFLVDVAMPSREECLDVLANRVQDRRWHFSPCMGLSEMLADVVFESWLEARMLEPGSFEIEGICPANRVRLRAGKDIGIHLLRMPYSVTPDRQFAHAAYYIERLGRPIPAESDSAWKVGKRTVVFS